MQTTAEPQIRRGPFRLPLWLGLCLFLGIALFFLWEEHQAHILGAAPYILLLLCPIIHLFMHRGHDGHDGAGDSGDEDGAGDGHGRGDAS